MKRVALVAALVIPSGILSCLLSCHIIIVLRIVHHHYAELDLTSSQRTRTTLVCVRAKGSRLQLAESYFRV